MEKNRLFLITILAIFGLYSSSKAQRTCGSDLNINQIQTIDVQRYNNIQNLEQLYFNYRSYIQSGNTDRIVNPNSTIIIPVVVHILHRGENIGTGLNISDAQIFSQIAVLNEDFRRLNADRINTPNAFTGQTADPNIEFRLACTDPNGNPTNGITRTFTPIAIFSRVSNNGVTDENATCIKFTSLGGRDAWTTNRYLNIWVCNLGNGLLGYAQFPFDYVAKPNTDGVVIQTQCFGRVGIIMPLYNLGRTTTHEIGHWLNLRHIWGDSNCGNDECDDTPTQSVPNYDCPLFPHQTCGNTTNGDMFMNYLDYTPDACMNLFTINQRDRMRSVFMQGGPRASFINNYFTINKSVSSVCVGSNVSISAQNICCLPITWTVQGAAHIISGQNTNQIIISGDYNGFATITATTGSYIDTYNISVGKPTNISVSYVSNLSNNGDNYYKILPNSGNYAYEGSLSLFDASGLATSYEWSYYSDVAKKNIAYWWSSDNTVGVGAKSSNAGEILKFTASNSCGSIYSYYTFYTGTITLPPPAVLSIYPNPATDFVTVSVTQSTLTENNLLLNTSSALTKSDYQGAYEIQVWSEKDGLIKRLKSDVPVLQIPVNDLTNGIYYIHLTIDNKIVGKKILMKN